MALFTVPTTVNSSGRPSTASPSGSWRRVWPIQLSPPVKDLVSTTTISPDFSGMRPSTKVSWFK